MLDKKIPVSSLKRSYNIKYLLLDRYVWSRAKSSNSGKRFLSYLFGKHFQDRLRAMAHAGLLGENYNCPYCQSGLNLSKKEMNQLEDQLAKLGNVRIPELINDALVQILGLSTSEVKQQMDIFSGKDYSLVSYLYHMDKSKFHHAFKFRASVRRKTRANYMDLVNGKDVDSLTYKDLENEINQISEVYGGLVVGCPACQGFGYLDVGHVDPSGKGSEMVRALFKLYQQGQKEISYNSLWNMFKNLKVEPQIATRPSEEWADKHLNLSTKRDADTGRLSMANQFKQFTNLMAHGINKELDRIRSLIISGTYAEDQNMITFEQGLKFYDKLISTSRVDTGTLVESLELERAKLAERLGVFTNDETVKVERGGIIQHVIPENFLYISGSTRLERTGKSGYKLKKGNRVYHSTTPRPTKGIQKVYAAFFSDLHFGYEKWTWSDTSGVTLSSLARQVFTSEQLTLLKVFPQLTEG